MENEEKNNFHEGELIPLSKAAKIAECTPEHLNLLARRKKIKAKKLGRNWFVKVERLNEYLEKKGKKKLEVVKTGKKEPEINKAEEWKIRRSDEILDFFEKEYKGPYHLKDESVKSNFKKFLVLSFTLSSVIIILFVYPFLKYREERRMVMEDLQRFEKEAFFDDRGVVMGEEDKDEAKKEVAMASENYKIKQLRFGGDVEIIADEEKPLEIENVRSETFLTKSQNEAKLVITWRTNKLASSEIEYAKNNGEAGRILKENSFGFNHGVIIPGLDLGNSYVYRIKARDKWGNEEYSDYFAVYSGSKAVSVVELISQELEKIFGWAIRK